MSSISIADVNPPQNVTARMPRPYHDEMKQRAVRWGLRVNDYYVQVIEAFVSDELPQRQHLYATPSFAVPISVPMPTAFVERVRSAAKAKGATMNELVITAVALHLKTNATTSA
ncbi:hypothetical protein ACN2C7_10055 [Caulobacter sp. ErkDOM-E]|uniref:hypothetical protein n=1 Tax=Caulobacter sp. ErkDOM-E TaxID=3402778 RepID=UPI003AF65F08